MLAFMLVKT